MITIVHPSDHKNQGGHYQSQVIYKLQGAFSGIISTSPEFTTPEASAIYFTSVIRSINLLIIETFMQMIKSEKCDIERLSSALKYFHDNDTKLEDLAPMMIKLGPTITRSLETIKLPLRLTYSEMLEEMMTHLKNYIK